MGTLQNVSELFAALNGQNPETCESFDYLIRSRALTDQTFPEKPKRPNKYHGHDFHLVFLLCFELFLSSQLLARFRFFLSLFHHIFPQGWNIPECLRIIRSFELTESCESYESIVTMSMGSLMHKP